MDVQIKNTDEIHEGVRVSRSIYNEIEIGSEVKGLVCYYGDEFLKIEIKEQNYITETSVSTVVQEENVKSTISYLCTECGESIEENWKYCSYCGEAIEE